MRRVFGEKASSIRWHLMGQALLNVALAVLMAYALLVIIIQKGLVDEWLKCDLSFGHNGSVIGMTVVLALFVPIVAAVICLTVTVQSWRAAKERPVDTIMK